MQNTIEKRDGYDVANDWLTSEEAALYLKIERRTLLQWVRQRKVAELGSAFLCADLELHQEPREENVAYLATWLEVLKNDNRAIFAAAAHAQRAADYLNQKAATAPEAVAV